MAKRGARRAAGSGLTPRQQEWLGHLRACERSGEAIRAYARRRRLSEHALYQAAKELRRRGVLRGKSRGPGVSAASFLKVETPVRAGGESAWRLRLPNGVWLEGSPPLSGEALELLIQGLARL